MSSGLFLCTLQQKRRETSRKRLNFTFRDVWMQLESLCEKNEVFLLSYERRQKQGAF